MILYFDKIYHESDILSVVFYLVLYQCLSMNNHIYYYNSFYNIQYNILVFVLLFYHKLFYHDILGIPISNELLKALNACAVECGVPVLTI